MKNNKRFTEKDIKGIRARAQGKPVAGRPANGRGVSIIETRPEHYNIFTHADIKKIKALAIYQPYYKKAYPFVLRYVLGRISIPSARQLTELQDIKNKLDNINDGSFENINPSGSI